MTAFYPLAPDQVYPAQALSIEASWEYLSRHPGVDKSRMVLLGDSAGGGLCVALMNSLAKGEINLPKPSQAM
jgi:acetyl esterase/lipase